MEEFQLGDIVVLKSGGPAMTVYQVDSQYVYTIWFFENKIYKDGFIKAILTKKSYEV